MGKNASLRSKLGAHGEMLFSLNALLHTAAFAYKENVNGMFTTKVTQYLKTEGQRKVRKATLE